MKWIAMIKDWERFEKTALVKSRIRKGIPDNLRGLIWQSVCNLKGTIAENEGKYAELACSNYIPCQDIRDTIERDIDRTFPSHQVSVIKSIMSICKLASVLKWGSLTISTLSITVLGRCFIALAADKTASAACLGHIPFMTRRLGIARAWASLSPCSSPM